jgi:hypothetical protein
VQRAVKPAGKAYSIVRDGNLVTVTVASDLPASTRIYYHWYVDGIFQATTTAPSRSFHLPGGYQARIEVVDTLDPALDPYANAPVGYPARQTIHWCRSISTDVAAYRVEQKVISGSWHEIGRVRHVPGQWYYTFVSQRLNDLTYYYWRVVPIDAVGNETSGVTEMGPIKIVRHPDAPDWSASYDDGAQRVTFSEA